MLKKPFIFLFAGIFATGCGPQKESPPKPPASEKEDSFFPVTQYILGQLKELDSLPVTPLKITIKNGKQDSTWIKRQEIRSLAQPFLTPVIDSIHWYKSFSQRSFLDQTINAFTFSYDPAGPLPDTIALRRWDVYVDPGTSKVKRIFIVKQLDNNNAPQTIQLTWKTGFFLKITTITEKPASTPEITEEQVIWNFTD